MKRHHLKVVSMSVHGFIGIRRAVLDALDEIEEQGGVVVSMILHYPDIDTRYYEIWWKK